MLGLIDPSLYYGTKHNEGNIIDPKESAQKLIKNINKSTPSSPTWHLMFKNVYSLGGYDINSDELEVDIVRDLGAGLELTHPENGTTSYLTIFGLDKEDQNYQNVLH